MPNPPEINSSSPAKYKGVRKRKWGKWVSEIRLPNSRDRIWLGSYDSPEKAARAFDAGSFLLRGHRASLNFPDGTQEIAFYCSRRNPTARQIQTAAARYAHVDLPAAPRPAFPACELMEQLMELTGPLVDEFEFDVLLQGEELEQMDVDVESGSCLWNF